MSLLDGAPATEVTAIKTQSLPAETKNSVGVGRLRVFVAAVLTAGIKMFYHLHAKMRSL